MKILNGHGLIHKINKLHKPIIISTASAIKHTITHSVDLSIFGIRLTFYVLEELMKIIIGKPTLQQWHYSLDPEGQYVRFNNKRYQVNTISLSMGDKNLEKIRDELTKEVLKKYPALFDTKLRAPMINEYAYQIQLSDYTPIIRRPYKCSPYEEKLVRQFVEEKVQAGILKPAPPNAFLYPVFPLVKKTGSNTGEAKIAVDMRPLNKRAITVPTYAMDIKDLFVRIQAAKYYTVIDLKFAYGQIAIAPESQRYFGIITHIGAYTFTCLPYGFKNSPSIFLNLINRLLHHLKGVFTYVDDIIIYHNDLQAHIAMVKRVLHILNENNLQINFQKVQLLAKRVKFLGYILKPNSIHPEIDKILTIKKWQPPKTTTELRSYINFSNHFRVFLPNIAKFTAPLTELLKHNLGKKVPIQHTKESLQAFHDLQNLITGLPTLHFYDSTKPTIIFTDASQTTIAGYIAQFVQYNGQQALYPICFLSHKLTDTQSRYSSMERELLAIVTILEKFRYYCLNDVEIYTDHQSLALLQQKDSVPPPRILRFLDIIGSYSPKIFYIQGKFNFISDMLTRFQLESIQNELDEEELLRNSATLSNISTVKNKLPKIEAISIEDLDEDQLKVIQKQLEGNNKNAQEDDPDIPLQQFKMHEGKLHVIIDNKLIECVSRDEYYNRALAIHNVHHPSPRITNWLTLNCCWHPDHKLIVTSIIRQCSKCQMYSSISHAIRPYRPIEPLQVFQRWALDYTGPLYHTHTHRYILVAVEYVSGVIFAIATQEKSAANALFLLTMLSLFVTTPQEIITDRGLEFASKEIEQFCQNHNINHKRTLAYHPIANGRVEHCNFLLKKIIKGLSEKEMKDWENLLFDAVNIYNSTPSIYNFSPRYLAYGLENKNDYTQLQKELIDITEKQNQELIDSGDEEATTHRDLVHIRLYELDKLKKNQELHSDLKKRRVAVRNILKEPYGIPATFLKGMWVLKERAKASKLEPNFDGPFQIKESYGKGDYKLIDIEGNDRGIHHQDRLKLAFSSEDNPIVALSSFNKEYSKIEKKLLNKMLQEGDQQGEEQEVFILTREDLARERKKFDIC